MYLSAAVLVTTNTYALWIFEGAQSYTIRLLVRDAGDDGATTEQIFDVLAP